MKGFFPNYGTVTHAPGTPEEILEALAKQVKAAPRIVTEETVVDVVVYIDRPDMSVDEVKSIARKQVRKQSKSRILGDISTEILSIEQEN